MTHPLLPQTQGQLMMTDGGLETTLIFHEHINLPNFAAFVLLDDEAGQRILADYFERYIALAKKHKIGMIMETPTWRASGHWAQELGYDEQAVHEINCAAIEHCRRLRTLHETTTTPICISGCIGPRFDGYAPEHWQSAQEAMHYHQPQIKSFASAGADMVSAYTITDIQEAIGLTMAAQSIEIPIAISFTVETNGRLPGGQSIAAAIEQVDEATDNGPAYYMINCAHPTHFEDHLPDAPLSHRIMGIRANASTMSHEELDNSDILDDGDPPLLGTQYTTLQSRLPRLTVFGGCCGTDHRHLDAICSSCVSS